MAGVVTIGLAAVVLVPTVFSSHKSALSSSFQRVLLTPTAVSSVTGDDYRINTASDNSEDDDASTGCMEGANGLTSQTKDTADASRAFATADHNGFVVEALVNNPTNAQQMDQLRSALKSCSVSTFAGATVSLQPLTMPQIAGSDDALGIEMTGQIGGTSLVMDMAIARYGNTVVAIMLGEIDGPQSLQNLTDSLLTQAAVTARPTFPKP